jgi:hypothetical protein
VVEVQVDISIIAIAYELKFRFPDAEFFVGAKDKMEMPVFKLGVVDCWFTKENKFTKFDVSI